MNKIYIGNMPYGYTKDTLETHFALCGPILDTKIINFIDNGEGRSYAFITFEKPESVAKALLFNGSTLESYKLHISKATETKYKCYIDGITNIYDEEYMRTLKLVLDAEFGSKYDPKFELLSQIGGDQKSLVISFYDDENRQKFVESGLLSALLSVKAKIKESPKKMESFLWEGKFEIVIGNVPSGTNKNFFEDLFRLCGPFQSKDVRILPSESNLTTAFINFTTKIGEEKALQFNNSLINGWPIPIIVDVKSNSYEKFQHTAIVRNFGSKKLKEIENLLCPAIGNLKVVRPSNPVKPGEDPFLYANFKYEEDLEKALEVSKRINLGGNGPAIITRKNNFNRQNWKSSTESLAYGRRNNDNNSPIAYSGPNIGNNQLNVANWIVTIQSDKNVDLAHIGEHFRKIGNVTAIYQSGQNYTVKLNVTL